MAQQGDPKLDTFDSFTSAIIEKYMEMANYSRENDFNASATTVIGVAFKGKADIETTGIKKALREQKLIDLLEVIVMVNNQFKEIINIGDELPTITINSFAALDKEEQKQNIREMKELGLLTYKDLINHYFNYKGEINKIQSKAAELKLNINDVVEPTKENPTEVENE